ncbi:IMP cyclohydrolase [Thermodesulforhabdus norvegica]|uniref:Phosphoribosylaminoimidazolecarboxamide formyltransferase / IMP cyclohydrolase n=1 Tax=Thermodesulforhabdus norvegica TaxID=39841 RepID=A0A1I4UYU9_9BACT|nr:IMP cyclohydrolase [Thermodesulforhabdus norvegica]SFM94055.1 phosphoribosylaminoimidazolecarboxamide formyltransferase / IMP cyclohydrolase [Thermodesulforhabdus norvegica]
MIGIKRALISVTDKRGLPEFGRFLQNRGVHILSTGGTARLLRDNGVEITDVSDYTGFPEILDGRVKTLHPRIHGGILAVRSKKEHLETLEHLNIEPIDMVVVNLYAFEKTVATPGCTLEDAVENIDIGGPTLIRAAAKNFRHVVVVCDPDDYPTIMDEMTRLDGRISTALSFALAKKAFCLTHRYDGAICQYLENQTLSAE